MEPEFKCGFDENGNPALYEMHSNGKRSKAVTKFPDGSVVFEKPYDSWDEAQKETLRKGLESCPHK